MCQAVGADRPLGDQQPRAVAGQLVAFRRVGGQLDGLQPGGGGHHQVALRGQQFGDRAGPVDVLHRARDELAGKRVHAVHQRLVVVRAEPFQPDHRAAAGQVQRVPLRVGRLVLGDRQDQRPGVEAERREHRRGRLEPGHRALDVQRAERGQEPAAAPLDQHQPVLFQQLQRLPRGAAAHPAQLGDLRLARHPVARAQVSVLEQADELIAHLGRHRPTIWHPVFLGWAPAHAGASVGGPQPLPVVSRWLGGPGDPRQAGRRGHPAGHARGRGQRRPDLHPPWRLAAVAAAVVMISQPLECAHDGRAGAVR